MKPNTIALGALAIGILALPPLWVSTASPAAGPRALTAALTSDVSPEASATRVMDAAALEGCVSRRRGGRTAAGCIGLIAEACLSLGASPHGEAGCYRREAEAWSTLVDMYGVRLEQRYSTDVAKTAKLHNGQTLWVAERAKRCERVQATADGSMGVPAGAACTMKESGRRALHLRQLADQAGVL